MLLSATPLNNRPDDIANQIYLFQDARKSTIDGVSNLQSFFYDKIKKYQKIKRDISHEELVEKVKEIYLPIRDLVFKELVIRRTRADIKRIDRYQKDIEEQGMIFPKENPPISIHYVFDDTLNALFVDTTITLIDHLGYYRYRAVEYINDEYQDLYDNAVLISRQLAMIMKTQLIKRLESSFHAFKISIKRLQTSYQRMITMFENDKIYIAPDLDVNKFYDEGKEEELEDRINELNEESPKNAIYVGGDFDEQFLKGLKIDKVIIDELVAKWNQINYDPKWDKFIAELEQTFLGKKNLEKKIVIFSESKDTVDYLKGKLTQYGRKDVLDVSSKNQKNRYNAIRKNFDANLKKEEQEHKYNIIVTTEVLAEGINLHRSNVILNYDIPWNATRLMQRIGRVNRLGTQADEIFVYNFYPTAESDGQISLNQKALKKLQGFHAAFGEDNKVYHEQEELIDNILGELDAHEEVNEILQQLEFLRNFKEQNFEAFKRIKQLPLKSRTGRLASIKKREAKNIFGQSIKDSCLCYIRNNKKDAFFLVNATTCQELTFSTAVRLFTAKEGEKRKEIIPTHFDWVHRALNEFYNNTNINQFNAQVDKTNLSVQERNAIQFLDALIQLSKSSKQMIFDDEFLTKIETGKMIVYKGIFRKFRLEVARLASKQKKNRDKVENVVKELEKIFSKYPIEQITRLEELRKEEAAKAPIVQKPIIVLSETFK